jgi:hypothetical protein
VLCMGWAIITKDCGVGCQGGGEASNTKDGEQEEEEMGSSERLSWLIRRSVKRSRVRDGREGGRERREGEKDQIS